MRVHLHIDRLVLEGPSVSPHAGRALSIAVEAELTRLIESGALQVSNGISVPRLSAPGVTLDPGATPRAMGTHIAGSLISGLSQPVFEPAQVAAPSLAIPREIS